MKYIFIFICLFVFSIIGADEKVNKVKTLQSYGLDFVENEYRLATNVFAADENKMIWIEAENSYLLSFYTNGDFSDLETASGKKIIFDIMSASYQINLPDNKTYDVWLRVYMNVEGSANIDSFIDGDVNSAKTVSVKILKDNLNKWAWVKLNSFKKLEEYQKLTLSCKGNNLLLDKILISESGKLTPQKINDIHTQGKEKKVNATRGTWLSEVFRPAGVRKWNLVKIASRNEDSRLFKIFWKTRTRDWTLLNKSHNLDIEADYKNGDFIQFKIDFYKQDEKSTYFSGLDIAYETNPFVLKEGESKSGKISVSFINGKIYELMNKTTGKNYLPVDQGVMPFLIYAKTENGDVVPIDENDFYPYKPDIKKGKDGEQILKVSYKGEKSNIKVDLTMTFYPNSDVIDSSIEIKNKSDLELSSLEYPRFTDVVMSNSWEEDKLVYPLLGGLKINAPAAGVYLNNVFPDDLSMRWTSIYGKNGALMIIDKNEDPFNFKVWHNVSMNGVNISVVRSLNKSSKMEYNSKIVIHDGAWQRSADIYGGTINNKKESVELFSSFIFDNNKISGLDNLKAIALYHEYLNSDCIESNEGDSRFLNYKGNKLAIHETEILTESLPKDKAILEVNQFGDNPEVFRYTFPKLPIVKSFNQSSNYDEILNYYQEQWVYNRILPISGSLGRSFLQAKNRIEDYIKIGAGVEFKDALEVEEYQNNQLLMKRYDYSVEDLKLVTFLYKSKQKNQKIKLNLRDIGRVSAVFHNDVIKGVTTLPFEYIENEIHISLPDSSYDVGSIILLHGNHSKSMVKTYCEYIQDKSTPVIRLTLINFSSSLNRLKISNLTQGINLEGKLQTEIKPGAVETIDFNIKNYLDLNTKTMIQLEVENQSQGIKTKLGVLFVPNVINGDFSASENGKPEYWTSTRDLDSYIGNNKKGSFKFNTPISSLNTQLFIVGSKKYSLQYSFNISGEYRGLNFEIMFCTGGKGPKNISSIKFKSPETKDFDFWNTESFEFETPANLQNAWLKITSVSSKGVVWLDDLKINIKE